jgi:3-carboxy-cis,cis-muconate cycloisomerase
MDVFAHPWLSGLFGDPEIADLLSAEAQLKLMMRVEAAYARALFDVGAIDQQTCSMADELFGTFSADIEGLRAGCAQDGLVVPNLVKQLKQSASKAHTHAIHTGLTSQDVIDTALVLALRSINRIFAQRISKLDAALAHVQSNHGSHSIMARTRMQAALSMTAWHRIEPWRAPLPAHLQRLREIEPRLLRLQFGGATGDRAASGHQGSAIAAAIAAQLEVGNPPKAWHTMRDAIAEYASWLSLVTGTLGKMGLDIALMAQQGIDEIALSDGGGSSAMPHKQNPILAELLVTLAAFNATQIGGMHRAMAHEQERSGMAWALEWMLLPAMIKATGRALNAGLTLCERIEHMGTQES